MMKVLQDKLLYLRKSRQDDPRETVEEVLAKHEIQLQEYCEREFGGRIPPENIYREIVSGESIAAREKIQQVLARIEDPQITGVVVTEPTRLSRGDLDDCGQIVKAFRFSRTLVHTMSMTYDLEKKMERKFFQDELLRGNDFLEFIKERLWFGRIAAAKRGAYVNKSAPFGYDRVKKGKEWTLEPNDNADTVRMIFRWYNHDGLTGGEIAKELNARGIKTGTGIKWNRDKVIQLLRNKHYTGKIVYNYRQTVQMLEDGEIVKRRVAAASEEDVIESQGLHVALIDMETWEKAQEKFGAPKVRTDTTLQNPLAGILRCAGCGRMMRRAPYRKATHRYICRSAPVCYKSAPVDDVLSAVIYALENSELPALQTKLSNGDGDARKIQERMLAKLEKEMDEYRERKERLFEFLENGTYTPDVFDERSAKLRAKMDECQAAIYRTKSTMPDHVDYAERIITLQNAIDLLKDPNASAKEQNKLLKLIVDRIEYTGAGARFTDTGYGETPFELKVTLKL